MVMFQKIFYKNTLSGLIIIFLSSFLQAQTQKGSPLSITIDANDKAQIIKNIGASGCWFSEGIGKHWPIEKKERIAELLFSRKINSDGSPKGIGLSAWRFNIGGGTQEQGVASGIRDSNHRVESFLNPDGTYDWSKQSGYVWFLKKAKMYGVEELIAFSNTPPVQFTLNGLGYKTEKDGIANLMPEKYPAFADFLTEVIKHFDKEDLHFSYISPVNEPQWDWTGTMGTAKQEGSPWTNAEIYRIVKSLDSSLQLKKLKTKILAPEAGMLSFLYGNKTPASRQIQNFFSDTSKLNFGNFKTVPRLVAGHSYFTDVGDTNIITTRKNLADTAKKYNVDFWQSEYALLGNGFKEGDTGQRTQMDCALFFAKIIHHDFTVANATAWHLWNAYEPGRAEFNPRYYLIALTPDSNFVNGKFTVTKNLWGLGHYSLFIRPGMQRLNIKRSDKMNDMEAAQKTMVSAYKDEGGRLVIVAINYAKEDENITFNLQGFKKIYSAKTYQTTSADNMNMQATTIQNLNKGFKLPPRSITTVVVIHY